MALNNAEFEVLVWKDGLLRFRGVGLEVYQVQLSHKPPYGGGKSGGEKGGGGRSEGWVTEQGKCGVS